MEQYIIGIDQSTQGTKAILFDENGRIMEREDLAHRQIINEKGWVEHDPEEIYRNTIQVVKNLVNRSNINKRNIAGVGISNQRETALAWDKVSGKAFYNAIVWQCSRGEQIAEQVRLDGYAEPIRMKTGLKLSPYFSAAKLAWIMQNMEEAGNASKNGTLCLGTIDSWLIYRLTGGKEFRADYSNSCRTQLFNINTLQWDSEICRIFDIPIRALPEVTPSDAYFGETDFEGFLDHPVPIHGVMGDSHAALFGQGCLQPGMIKATYGTGSSIMMNVGDKPVFSSSGVVSSLAWFMGGKPQYVLEGNINYAGAVISWLINDVQLIGNPSEASAMPLLANQDDHTYLVPAFSGIGAPYWVSDATATMTGMTRTTGRNEIVKAAVECIAYQITDIVNAMRLDAGTQNGLQQLRVDGGPTRNSYLMQFQADMLHSDVQVANVEELSGIGAAFCAGIALGIYDANQIFQNIQRTTYSPRMPKKKRDEKMKGWKQAVELVVRAV